MNDKKHQEEPIIDIKNRFLGSIRQLCFPAEFRIAAQSLPPDSLETVGTEPKAVPVSQKVGKQASARDSVASNQLVAELATCLWYLKTKHFKREWDDAEIGDNDPRVRRALSRLNKSIEALKESGINVHDPTNKRYPQGSEGTMHPIQLLPTAGLAFEMVSETVAPIIYRDDRLIRRGEVFVAVPKEEANSAAELNKTPTSPEPDAVDPIAEKGLLKAVSQKITFSDEADSQSVEAAVAQEVVCSDGDVLPPDAGTEVDEPDAAKGGDEREGAKCNEPESACETEDAGPETLDDFDEDSEQGSKGQKN